MNLTHRQIHRDVAYFYVGLILAFSFSGIILNHRQSWYPTEYAYESEEVTLKIPKGNSPKKRSGSWWLLLNWSMRVTACAKTTSGWILREIL